MVYIHRIQCLLTEYISGTETYIFSPEILPVLLETHLNILDLLIP